MNKAAILASVERVLMTVWIGGLWVSGLVFAPMLFANFERELAGDIAGDLFLAMSRIGIGCGLPLLALAVGRAGAKFWRDWNVVVLVAMLLIVVVGEFGVAAQMRQLKALAILEGVSIAGSPDFGRLHAVSSSLYLLECLLGLVLVVRRDRLAAQSGS